MKFGRYLEETQTPEWKKAYVNYRGLKKLIAEIGKSREATDVLFHSPPPFETPQPSSSDFQTPSGAPLTSPPLASSSIGPRSSDRHDYGEGTSPDTITPRLAQGPDETTVTKSDHDRRPTRRKDEHTQKKNTSFTRSHFPSFHTSRHISMSSPLPLLELFPLLTPIEKSFFTALDVELNKVESFYLDREQELLVRTGMLEQQLEDLVEHRKLFYETHPKVADMYLWTPLAHIRSRLPKAKFRQQIPRFGETVLASDNLHKHSLSDVGDENRTVTGDGGDEMKRRRARSASPGARTSTSGLHNRSASTPLPVNPRMLDPEDYGHAKKKLKKAVQEHYRVLELLNNYRILNLTGFRKALKKFEKVTKIPAQRTYMQEKVELTAFASGKSVAVMIKEMEELFTARFEQGDKKKAMANLRATSQSKSHHFSTFRSGLLLGLSLPALVSGLYQSFQEDTRAAIPGWDALLFVYSVFLLPVLFSLLVGLNILVWSESRINYIFIFELDVRTRLSSRKYFEIPSFLLATLFYAFWLSFSRIGSLISPTTWPLLWLGLTAFIMIDPLPLFFRPSRWWLLISIGKVLVSGTRRVEFADFWMGDQFCSLIYTLSNLYLVACAYTTGFDHALQRCGATRNWVVPFVLAALPLWLRFVQSVKRYVDSKLITHLVNGGKYATGIIAYFFYFTWRHDGHRASLVLWCFFSTLYAIYAASWDTLMDWSMLRPHVKPRFLRAELVYTDHIPLYYFAIISNVVIRFIWIFYVPVPGPSAALRSFICAMLEMLRRLQWNLFRLENEHIGNMDQYRVTREVPLPYAHDELVRESDKEENSEEDRRSGRKWLKRHRTASPLQKLPSESG